MSAAVGVSSLEVIQTHATDDDGICHTVCHCTDDRIAACGLDVSGVSWVEVGVEDDCPLCVLRWPDDAVACPWGCACEECG